MKARRLVGKVTRELEASALVQAGQLKRRGRGILGHVADVTTAALLRRGQESKNVTKERYSNALLELQATYAQDQTIAALLLALTDPDVANRKRDTVFQVTVVATDGRREPASYATGLL